MAPKPLVTIIVETGTRKTTGRIPFEKMAKRHFEEARRSLSLSQFEILFVGDGWPKVRLSKNCRFLNRPGSGYYGFKNEGARAAQGKYVVFWDSDCKIKPGYLKRMLELYKENPQVIAIAGRSYYDHPHLLSLVNTIICFGPFCQAPPRLTKLSAISHNVSIRKSAYPADPFGPFTGRTGGDMFITEYAVKAGKPILFDKDLEIFHEDVTTHLEALMERLLRDLFTPVVFLRSRSKWAALASGYFHWPVLSLKRLRRVLIYRKSFGLRWYQLPGSVLALAYFGFLEMAALIGMTFRPTLLMRWLNFQFGPQWIQARGIR